MSTTQARLAIASLIAQAKRERFTTGYKATDAEAFGLLIAGYFQWDGVAILRAAEAALEDANFHTEAAEVSAMADAYKPVVDPDALIDGDTRKAVFAALRERFGHLDRAARLRKLSVLAGRTPDNPIVSLSDRAGNMTNRDASRFFDVLKETA